MAASMISGGSVAHAGLTEASDYGFDTLSKWLSGNSSQPLGGWTPVGYLDALFSSNKPQKYYTTPTSSVVDKSGNVTNYYRGGDTTNTQIIVQIVLGIIVLGERVVIIVVGRIIVIPRLEIRAVGVLIGNVVRGVLVQKVGQLDISLIVVGVIGRIMDRVKGPVIAVDDLGVGRVSAPVVVGHVARSVL